MDKAMLYDCNDCCKICEQYKDADHKPECPGAVIDKMVFRASFYGRLCPCGCCGSVDDSETDESLESLIATVARRVSECVSYKVTLTYGTEEGRSIYAEVQAQIMANDEAENRRREAAAEAAEEKRRQQRLATLELERPDLTPEAYARKKEALSG